MFQISESLILKICEKDRPRVCSERNFTEPITFNNTEYTTIIEDFPVSESIITVTSTHNGLASFKSNRVVLEIDSRGNLGLTLLHDTSN